MSDTEIEIDIPDNLLGEVIFRVINRMSDPSQSVFSDSTGGEIHPSIEQLKEGLYKATINEGIVELLQDGMKTARANVSMDCYIIPPLNHLDLMDEGKGNRYFCLAHFFVSNEEYKNFFLDLRTHNPTAFITLDNSAAERSLVTEQVLIDIVEELKPDEVIAPDVLLQKDKTLANLDAFILKMKARGLDNHTNIFACPQGNTKTEWLECYDKMAANIDVSVIGLSKIAIPHCWLGEDNDASIKEARQACVSELISSDRMIKPLHCLGMGDPTEFVNYVHPLIRSTDSCYSVLSAVNNVSFDQIESEGFTRIPTTNDFYTITLNESELDLAKNNIAFLVDILTRNVLLSEIL